MICIIDTRGLPVKMRKTASANAVRVNSATESQSMLFYVGKYSGELVDNGD